MRQWQCIAWFFEIGVLPRRGSGKRPNPAAMMAALPTEKEERDFGLKGNPATSAPQQAARDESECGELRRWFRDRSEFTAGNTEANVAALVAQQNDFEAFRTIFSVPIAMSLGLRPRLASSLSDLEFH